MGFSSSQNTRKQRSSPSKLTTKNPTDKMDHLPIDITTTILSKLPVESVFRCRSVCKTWCTVIDDPNFHTLHTNSSQTQNTNPPLILIPLNKRGQMMAELFFLQDYNNPYRPFHWKCTKMKLPFEDGEFDKFLVGSCNGLFCFFSLGIVWRIGGGQSMWVCNPSTRECVTLPEVTFSDDAFLKDVSSGFGLARTAKVFKVVNMFSLERFEGQRELEIRVLTLGSNAWRSIGHGPVGIRIWGRQVFVDGYVYWIYFTSRTIGIISFDLEAEMIEFVPNPDFRFFTFRQIKVSNCLILGVLDGCLCVADRCSFNNWHEIWVMKEKNVWIKQFVIRKDILNWIRIRMILPICFWNNGELILLCDSELLVSYNVETGIAVPLLLGNDDLLTRYFHAIAFAGSFISPQISLLNIA